MKRNMNAYQKLCTQFYDISKPTACPNEVEFYHQFLERSKGPILEAMSGSGRLMIPLLKKGHDIDGCDASIPMIESCFQRCKKENLKAEVFNQPLQQLQLQKKYDLIFIAVGSFQLLADKNEAFLTLLRLYDHLQPGGSLLIDTFVPWDFLQESIQEDLLLPNPKKSQTVRKVFLPDDSEIVLKMESIFYPKEQYCHNAYLYEKRQGEHVMYSEEESLSIRWYYRYEMELFLEKAGFSVEHIYDMAFEHNSQAVVFHARKI
jgi:SAM-dependent methyltransferase